MNAILKTTETAPADTPEAEFAARWKVGASFAGEFDKMLGSYYDAVTTSLTTQSGFDRYFKLAEERRQIFNRMPISEFPLLLPRTSSAPVAGRNPTARGGGLTMPKLVRFTTPARLPDPQL